MNAAVDLDGRDQSVTKNVTLVHGVLIVSIVANVKPVIQKQVTADHAHRAILVHDVVNHAQTNGGEINAIKCVLQVLCQQKGKWDHTDYNFSLSRASLLISNKSCSPGEVSELVRRDSEKCENISCGRHGWCYEGQCMCAPGFRGNRCNERCRPGTWGQNCQEMCDCGQGGTCNGVTGICQCGAGFTGPKCSMDCPSGQFI